MPIDCLIVDDEPLALDLLKSYAERTQLLNIVGCCQNAVEAGHLLQSQKVDLLFLDIQMPKLTGFELLNTLRHPPKVIFTTAHRDFAIKAFEIEALDYLLKPISFQRFLKAINRAHHALSLQPAGFAAEAPEQQPPLPPTSERPEFVYIRSDRKMVKVKLEDILYIESLKDYVSIHTHQERYLTKQRISYMEEKLPTDNFLRVHRSFLIAIDKITAFSSSTIELGETEVPVGRSYRDEVLERLEEGFRI